MQVEFYDPHPGLAGCLAPIPESIRRIANDLDGRQETIQYAIGRIQYAADMLNSSNKGSAVPTPGFIVGDEGDYISLRLGDVMNLPCHSWRVIRYRKIVKKTQKPQKRLPRFVPRSSHVNEILDTLYEAEMTQHNNCPVCGNDNTEHETSCVFEKYCKARRKHESKGQA